MRCYNSKSYLLDHYCTNFINVNLNPQGGLRWATLVVTYYLLIILRRKGLRIKSSYYENSEPQERQHLSYNEEGDFTI